MMFRNFLLVGIGGAVGSMALYGVSFAMNRFVPQPHTWVSTFTVNIVGCLLIVILFGLSPRSHWLEAGGYLLLASGFCGGFTTFSSFALENVNFLQKGQSMLALAYVGLSIVLGLLFCRVGIWLAS